VIWSETTYLGDYMTLLVYWELSLEHIYSVRHGTCFGWLFMSLILRRRHRGRLSFSKGNIRSRSTPVPNFPSTGRSSDQRRTCIDSETQPLPFPRLILWLFNLLLKHSVASRGAGLGVLELHGYDLEASLCGSCFNFGVAAPRAQNSICGTLLTIQSVRPRFQRNQGN
jgi:hypothetical protein